MAKEKSFFKKAITRSNKTMTERDAAIITEWEANRIIFSARAWGDFKAVRGKIVEKLKSRKTDVSKMS